MPLDDVEPEDVVEPDDPIEPPAAEGAPPDPVPTDAAPLVGVDVKPVPAAPVLLTGLNALGVGTRAQLVASSIPVAATIERKQAE